MVAFDPTQVPTGPGTLYIAPIGTAEPTALTGAWTGWTALGYTDVGTTFSVNPTASDVMVAEEVYPVDSPITAMAATLAFAIAQPTAALLAAVLNDGFGSSLVAASTGSTTDGGTWVEPTTPGTEPFVMLGWDALPKAATAGATQSRLIVRKARQTGNLQMAMQKAPNKRMYTATFSAYKPTGVQPFRFMFPTSLAA